MSMTKNSPAFQRMLEQDQERERMELARREQEFVNLRSGRVLLGNRKTINPAKANKPK